MLLYGFKYDTPLLLYWLFTSVLLTNHEIEYIEVKQTYLPCFLAGATDFQEGFLSVAPYLVHSSKARCHAYQELKMT